MAIKCFVLKVGSRPTLLRLFDQAHTPDDIEGLKSDLAREYKCQPEEVRISRSCILLDFDYPSVLTENPIGAAIDALAQTTDGFLLLQHILNEAFQAGMHHGFYAGKEIG